MSATSSLPTRKFDVVIVGAGGSGMRDIFMDYVTRSLGLRLALQVFTLVWLVGCAGWAVQVLWRL